MSTDRTDLDLRSTARAECRSSRWRSWPLASGAGRSGWRARRCWADERKWRLLTRLREWLRGPQWSARHWRWMAVRAGGESALRARLLERRVVALVGPLHEHDFEDALARALYLADREPEGLIRVWIHSPGGHATGALAFFELMRTVPMSTACLGYAGGVAALLLAAGSKGRSIDPFGCVSLVDVSLEGGRPHRTPEELWNLQRIRTGLSDLLAERSGQRASVLAAAAREGTRLTAAEAVLYGFADAVATHDIRGEARRRPTMA